jgi:hypothetical protein
VGIGLPAVRQLICAYARCARLRVRCPGPLIAIPRTLVMLHLFPLHLSMKHTMMTLAGQAGGT